ncbi:MAG TPA: hypothetical protein VIG32_08550 [Candidatus Baltobacteraceae bacterium]
MELKLNRKEQTSERIAQPDDLRTHLVHRAGAAGSGLFPGWGPKL